MLNSCLFKLSKILEKYKWKYLLLLKLLSVGLWCFKNSTKITSLCFREWLINLQLRSYFWLEKRPSTKVHFPLKNAELNKQWIRFVNKRDWLATKHSILCKLYFEEKYLRRCEKYTLQWLMNPVLTVYPQKPSSKHHNSASSEKKILPRWIVSISTTSRFSV